MNNDGKMDLIFLNNNDFPQVLLNVSKMSGNWVRSIWADHPELMGGRISRLPPQSTGLQQTIAYNQALFGNSDPRFHFGLGSSDAAAVKITSPGGIVVCF